MGKIVELFIFTSSFLFMEERHGFLAFNDIQSDYYQIPVEDKEQLKGRKKKLEDLEEVKTRNLKIIIILMKIITKLIQKITITQKIEIINSENIEKTREKLKNRYGVRK